MGMDRNTVTGFVLIGILLIGMFYFNSRSNQAYLAEQKRVSDSIAKTKPKVDPIALRDDSLKAETARKQQSAGNFQQTLNIPESQSQIENDVFKISFIKLFDGGVRNYF